MTESQALLTHWELLFLPLGLGPSPFWTESRDSWAQTPVQGPCSYCQHPPPTSVDVPTTSPERTPCPLAASLSHSNPSWWTTWLGIPLWCCGKGFPSHLPSPWQHCGYGPQGWQGSPGPSVAGWLPSRLAGDQTDTRGSKGHPLSPPPRICIGTNSFPTLSGAKSWEQGSAQAQLRQAACPMGPSGSHRKGWCCCRDPSCLSWGSLATEANLGSHPPAGPPAPHRLGGPPLQKQPSKESPPLQVLLRVNTGR